MNKKLKSTLKKYSKQKEDKVILISGILGIPLNGVKTVEVPNRRGFVFVRLKGNTSELIQAYNSEVSPVYDLPVLVGRQGSIYKVFGRNLDRYQDWGKTPYLPKHGAQHSFNHALNIGGDIVWIYSQQFMPLLSYPSGTQGGMTLSIEPHFYEWQGSWRFAQNTGTPSYSPYLPTITGSARMVLSYIDPSDNSIKLVPGTPFSNSITGSSQLAQYIPDIPRSVGIPLSAVRLVTGTTQIGWDAIYDVRDFYTVGGSSSGTSVSSLNDLTDVLITSVQDEDILSYNSASGLWINIQPLSDVPTDGITYGRRNQAWVEISGTSSSGGFGILGQNKGVPLGTGTTLNVTGNIEMSISGTVLNISSPITTYQRFSHPVPVNSVSGTLWRVPENIYASGSLGIFYNGLVLSKDVQYEELIFVSGTYQLLFTPTTGSVHMASYGIPCSPQIYSTGTAVISEFALQDSDSELLLDSDGEQLLDSDG